MDRPSARSGCRLAAAALALAALGCPTLPQEEQRRFAPLDPAPAGYARVYVYHVGSGEAATEDVTVNGKRLGALRRGRVGLRLYCEYAVTTVPVGASSVEARIAGAFSGGLGAPEPIVLRFDARERGSHFVRVRTESGVS